MIPLKDDIPTDRVPVVTLLLIVAGAVAQLVGDGDGLLPLLASALFLWLFGVAVEDATSRPRFVACWLLGAGAAVAVGVALDADPAVAALAASGGTAAAVGGHAALYPRARVVTLLPIPTSFTVHEPPAWLWRGVWAAIVAAFAVTAVSGPLADGGDAALLGALGACALGALAGRLLARRRKRLAPAARSTTLVWS